MKKLKEKEKTATKKKARFGFVGTKERISQTSCSFTYHTTHITSTRIHYTKQIHKFFLIEPFARTM